MVSRSGLSLFRHRDLHGRSLWCGRLKRSCFGRFANPYRLDAQLFPWPQRWSIHCSEALLAREWMSHCQARWLRTGHSTLYNYDQHVPLFVLRYGIQSGDYFAVVTPADIAPTFAALWGITLATRDRRVLAEALHAHASE